MSGVVPFGSCSELALALVGPGVPLWICVFSGNVFLCFVLICQELFHPTVVLALVLTVCKKLS